MSTIGWVGFAVSTIGLALNARHRLMAQVIFIAGNALWIAYALDRQLPEMLLSQVLYLILNARTLRSWRRELKGNIQ